MADFLTSYIGHVENTGSLSYADLPNVDTFHYAIQKNHIFNVTINVRESGSDRYKFSKVWIFA